MDTILDTLDSHDLSSLQILSTYFDRGYFVLFLLSSIGPNAIIVIFQSQQRIALFPISGVGFGAAFSDNFLHYFCSSFRFLHSFAHISNILPLIVVVNEIYVIDSSCDPCHPDSYIVEI